jgi:AraC-like DNA-binding protein/DNA gyrase inhibitor GyrI
MPYFHKSLSASPRTVNRNFDNSDQASCRNFFYTSLMTFYEQIQASIDYAESQPMKTIHPHEAAEHAGMSLANFYRYFQALTGFKFMEYVRKRRISESLKLLEAGWKVVDVAIECAYESHEAYTRAFKKEFGIQPIEYRTNRPAVSRVEKLNLVEERIMGIIVKELESVKVARCRAVSESPEHDSWNMLSAWAKEEGLFETAYRIFGRNNPNPDEDPSLEAGVYGYEFAITLNEKNPRGTELVEIAELKGGKFAVMSIEIESPEKDIPEAWQKMGKFLEVERYKTTGRWYEEHLEFSSVQDGNPTKMDLYVEIQ